MFSSEKCPPTLETGISWPNLQISCDLCAAAKPEPSSGSSGQSRLLSGQAALGPNSEAKLRGVPLALALAPRARSPLEANANAEM